jgi:cell shape-determining protein MreC
MVKKLRPEPKNYELFSLIKNVGRFKFPFLLLVVCLTIALLNANVAIIRSAREHIVNTTLAVNDYIFQPLEIFIYGTESAKNQTKPLDHTETMKLLENEVYQLMALLKFYNPEYKLLFSSILVRHNINLESQIFYLRKPNQTQRIENAFIISDNGMLGIVVEDYGTYLLGSFINAFDNKTAVYVQTKDRAIIVTGQGINNNTLLINEEFQDLPWNESELVYTAAESTTFPPNYLIGEVTKHNGKFYVQLKGDALSSKNVLVYDSFISKPK